MKIAFFGDSVCVGQGVSVVNSWVVRLAAHLHELGVASEKPIIVTNSSVNGRTSRQALEDMPYHIQGQDIDLLVLQFGLNDCNFWLSDNGLPRVSRPAYTANMLEMVDRAFASGVRRVIINSNHPTTRTNKTSPVATFTYEENNERYYWSLKESFKNHESRLRFVDVRSHFLKFAALSDKSLESLLLDDGLHLSVAGHTIYYSVVLPEVQDCLHDLMR